MTASSALRPLKRVEQSVQRRGPHDMRPMKTQAPDEIVPLLVALNSFMDRLRRAHDRTEDFIAEAAHRVRTPLATVRANAEITLRSSKDQGQRQALRAMIRAVDESSRSASQLLDHAMVMFRSDQVAFKALDLAELVSQVVTDLSPTSTLRDITINLYIDHQPIVSGDKILLIGAIRNLLDNAIKYSQRDSCIDITLEKLGNLSIIRICDTGRGLGNDTELDLKKTIQER